MLFNWKDYLYLFFVSLAAFHLIIARYRSGQRVRSRMTNLMWRGARTSWLERLARPATTLPATQSGEEPASVAGSAWPHCCPAPVTACWDRAVLTWAGQTTSTPTPAAASSALRQSTHACTACLLAV